MTFPIALRLEGRRALVVGGGGVATRRALALARAGAAVCVVAPHVTPELRALLSAAGNELRERTYQSRDVEGAFMVFAATGDDAVNACVIADARAVGALACDAGEPARGDFSVPATARIGDLTVAVETDGAAPAFASRVASEVREHLGSGYGSAAATLRRMRIYAQAAIGDANLRHTVLSELAQLPVEQLATINPSQAEHVLEETLQRHAGAVPAASTKTVVCASRASSLALTQTRSIAAKLAQRGIATTILAVSTTGDRVQDRSITAIGTENVFVKEIEAALRDGRAGYAVHSCKDLASTLAGDLELAAIGAREDPRDAFCSERYARFDDLPPGARVGTSSPRRRAQLVALRPDLTYLNLRGNVDTRLRKLRQGEYDAIVLAMAGLKRLALRATHTVPFAPEQLVPAVGQGALAVQTMRGSALAHELRAAVNDDASELAICCERAALRALRGGCSAPIGIHARFLDGQLVVHAAVGASGGSTRIVRAEARRRVADVAQAEALGESLARDLANAPRL